MLKECTLPFYIEQRKLEYKENIYKETLFVYSSFDNYYLIWKLKKEKPNLETKRNWINRTKNKTIKKYKSKVAKFDLIPGNRWQFK